MVYDNIKRIADKKGLSIAEIESRANLGNGIIGKWRKSSPTVDKLVAVAKVLDVRVSKLLEG